MTSRELFEEWLVSEYNWAEDTLDLATFYGDDKCGYYVGGNYIYEGYSCADPLFWAWRGWQAKSITLK